MHRADLLKLTGLTSEALKNLAKRDIWAPPTDRAAEGWIRYTAEDALMICLILELAADGPSQSEAATVAAELWPMLRKRRDDLNEDDGGDVHVALLRVVTRDLNNPQVEHAGTQRELVGSLADLIEQYRELANRWLAEGPRMGGAITRVRGLRLVNVGLIAQEIRGRAERAGLRRPVFWAHMAERRVRR